MLNVVYADAKPSVTVDHKRITLYVRPDSTPAKRAAAIHDWHKTVLHDAIPPLLEEWQRRLGVRATGYFLQRMKTKWGSCNHRAGHIRLNTKLVKKPKDLLEYVIVHELLHLRVPNHGKLWKSLMRGYLGEWEEIREQSKTAVGSSRVP